MVFLSSCDGDGDIANTFQKAKLEENKSLWESQDISSYRFTYRVSCFCYWEDDVVVSVVNGDITGAFYLNSGLYLNEQELSNLYTITDIFDLAGGFIDENKGKLQITYNKDYGYPEVIDYDVKKEADNWVAYRLWDFQ